MLKQQSKLRLLTLETAFEFIVRRIVNVHFGKLLGERGRLLSSAVIGELGLFEAFLGEFNS